MNDTIGQVVNLRLEQLRPDWLNPRFSAGAVDKFNNDLDVYSYLDQQFDAASVAESIARHGFFQSEPLIAVVSEHDSSEYVVLEGNRRLTALQGLARPDVRSRLTDPRWKSIEIMSPPPATVPVLIARDRASVAPILGYRHVTGITPWDPFQQARYVAALIDESGMNAVQVADLIGRDLSEVRSFYRNFSIVEQARDVFQLADSERITDEFGVWNRAMTNANLREFIMAPVPRDVVEGEYPLPEEASEPLASLVTWVFGEQRTEEQKAAGRQSRLGRAISDSREITRLGKVVASERGLEALRAGLMLPEAELRAVDPAARFSASLARAKKELSAALEIASGDLAAASTEDIEVLGRQIEELRSFG